MEILNLAWKGKGNRHSDIGERGKGTKTKPSRLIFRIAIVVLERVRDEGLWGNGEMENGSLRRMT